MLVYDVYIKQHGKNYYQYFHLRGSEERFESIKAILAIYAKMHIIDAYYMFDLSPEDKEMEDKEIGYCNNDIKVVMSYLQECIDTEGAKDV